MSIKFKFSPLAALALSLGITACSSPSNGNHTGATPSPYAGFWMDQGALTVYRDHVVNGQVDLIGFCNQVVDNSTAFGLVNSVHSDVVLHAILVQFDGHILRFTPGMQNAHFSADQLQAMSIGHIDSSGHFEHGADETAGLHPKDPRFQIDSGRFSKLDEKHLATEGFRGPGSFGNMERTDADELEQFDQAVNSCRPLLAKNPGDHPQHWATGKPEILPANPKPQHAPGS